MTLTSSISTGPAHWASDVVVLDGGTAHVRPIEPADGEALVAFHGRLSEDTVYARFFSSKPTLSAAEVERFTHVDHDDRVALVAELGDRLVAVARYDRTAAPHPTSAGSGEQIADRRDEVAVPWAAGERHDRTRELVLMPMSTVRGIRS